jgi:uncharacterized protein YjbJ (UPF0337 family)
MTSYPNSEDPLRRDDDYLGDPDATRDPGDRTVGEKLSDAGDELAGKVKQGWGDLTDDERLQAEGRQQEAEADARQAADKAADYRDDPGL